MSYGPHCLVLRMKMDRPKLYSRANVMVETEKQKESSSKWLARSLAWPPLPAKFQPIPADSRSRSWERY
jgi:hypothetical protein